MGRVLHASYSGYFPSCIGAARTTGVANGSLSQIMSMYWRVKTWELLSASGSFIIYLDDEGNTATFEFTEGTKELGSTNATSEEALVCAKSFNNGVDITTIVTSPLVPGPSTIFTRFVFVYSPTISKSGENYQMSCRGYVEVQTSVLFSTFYEGTTVGQIYLSPLDISIPLRANVGVNASGNVYFALNATEWWSYGGLYDTATGELT